MKARCVRRRRSRSPKSGAIPSALRPKARTPRQAPAAFSCLVIVDCEAVGRDSHRGVRDIGDAEVTHPARPARGSLDRRAGRIVRVNVNLAHSTDLVHRPNTPRADWLLTRRRMTYDDLITAIILQTKFQRSIASAESL